MYRPNCSWLHHPIICGSPCSNRPRGRLFLTSLRRTCRSQQGPPTNSRFPRQNPVACRVTLLWKSMVSFGYTISTGFLFSIFQLHEFIAGPYGETMILLSLILSSYGAMMLRNQWTLLCAFAGVLLSNKAAGTCSGYYVQYLLPLQKPSKTNQNWNTNEKGYAKA